MISTNIQSRLRMTGIAIILASLLAIIQCAGGGTEVGNPSMDSFQNSRALEDYLKDQYASCILPEQMYTSSQDQGDKENIDTAGDSSSNSPNDAASDTMDDLAPNCSGTNNQEAGVYESDTIKADGTYLYVAGDHQVSIVDVRNPEDMQKVQTISIDGEVQGLQLSDSILVVLYMPLNDEGNPDTAISLTAPVKIGYPYWIPKNAQTGIRIIDVTVPEAPQTLRELVIDGELLSTRLVDAHLHLVQRFSPELPDLEYIYKGSERERTHVIAQNQTALAPLTLNDLVPSYRTLTAAVDASETPEAPVVHQQIGQLVPPQDFYHPLQSGGASIVTVTTFDLLHPLEDFKSVGIIADAEVVYASTRSLYIAATEWNYDQSFASNTAAPVQSVIYKFDLAGEAAKYTSSGRIDGLILNQFALEEDDQILQIATTIENPWRTQSQITISNSVYCLESTNNQLIAVGKIENLAPGERLFTVKFIGDKGFLVTSQDIDPLIILDLNDPTHPIKVGEFNFSGYAQFILELDANMLLSIGIDTQFHSLEQGLQLSVFNIDEFTAPYLIQNVNIGDRGTTSEALSNHKAFIQWAEKGLIALPVDLFGYPTLPSTDQTATYMSSGLYVYQVTQSEGFEFLGHLTTNTTNAEVGDYQKWTRGLFLDHYILAVQSDVVYAAELGDIARSVHKLSLIGE